MTRRSSARGAAGSRPGPGTRRRLFGILLVLLLLPAPALLDLDGAQAARHDQRHRGLDPFLGRISPGFQAWFSHLFASYRAAFILPDGRVLDPENGNVTHSEGLGYGMLLALAADDPATFERIWRFARAELQRPDGLFSWRWDPHATPHVADRNNATDGDILIAAALGLAAERWAAPALAREGARIADAIGDRLIVLYDERLLLLPAVEGFGTPHHAVTLMGRPMLEMTRSPVVNLSYWIYFAFPVLERLAPNHPWNHVLASGLELTVAAGEDLTDWSVLRDHAVVCAAPMRERSFGYNAIRIPLYMAMAGIRISFFNRMLLTSWGPPNPDGFGTRLGCALPRGPRLVEPGYRFVHAYLWCIEHNAPIDFSLFDFRPTTYYASSLHLFGLGAVYAFNPECVPG